VAVIVYNSNETMLKIDEDLLDEEGAWVAH
jgi:hypothetical protein